MLLLALALLVGVVSPRPGQCQYVHSKTLTSPEASGGADFGDALAGIGDVDGDKTADLVVGAEGDSIGDSNPGRAYLFSGSDGSLLRTFESPNPESSGLFGSVVASIEDVNGDSVPDVIVTADGEAVGESFSAGRVYLFSGADGGLLQTFESPNPESYGKFGTSAVGVGDTDGDERPDVLVGARGETIDGRSNSGRVYLFSSSDGSVLQTLQDPNAGGEQIGFGERMARVGERNENGMHDLVVGAYQAVVDGHEFAGRAYFISGTDQTIRQSVETPNLQEKSYFGEAVSGIGDVDDDGTADVLVGAFSETVDGHESAGRAYLFSGSDGSLLQTLESPSVEADERFGCSVLGVGDVTGDGTPDVMVGAHPPTPERADTDNTGPGHVYVFSGSDGRLIQTLSSPNTEERDGFGNVLTRARDGRPSEEPADVLIGAPAETVDEGGEQVGRAYLYQFEASSADIH